MSLNENVEAIQMYVMCAAGTNDSLPDNSWCQHRPSQEILNVYMQFKNEKWALAPEMRLNNIPPLDIVQCAHPQGPICMCQENKSNETV